MYLSIIMIRRISAINKSAINIIIVICFSIIIIYY